MTSTWAISMPSGGSGRLPIVRAADRNIEHLIVALDKEMVMIRHIGVEIGLGAFDGENTDHAGFGKLVQRVVNGCQRHRDTGGHCFFMQLFDREVAITLGKNQVGKQPCADASASNRSGANVLPNRFRWQSSYGRIQISKLLQNSLTEPI